MSPLSVASFPLEPTGIHVPEEVLADLDARLKRVRWPIDAGNDDGYYGVPRAYLQDLVEYWTDEYDWRTAETAINAYEHYRVDVGSVPVHFMRKAGVGPRPIPLILSHGWPWTFWHWSKVVDRLADPGAFGGDPAQAFDVIVPCLPGFGFSTPLTAPDMSFWRIADLWHELMTGVLGYEQYGAAGCDVGALVTGQLGHKYAGELRAIHIGSAQKLTLFNGERAWDLTGGQPIPDGVPPHIREQILAFDRRFAVHLAVHVLEPTTLGIALSDSPVGMLAWILQRWMKWSDDGGDIESVFSKDDLLTHAMIFWAGNAIGTSIRLYANNHRYPWTPSHDRSPVVEAPTGITFVGYENPPGITTADRVRSFLESDRAAWYNHVNITAHERWPLHPVGDPGRVDRRPASHVPRASAVPSLTTAPARSDRHWRGSATHRIGDPDHRAVTSRDPSARGPARDGLGEGLREHARRESAFADPGPAVLPPAAWMTLAAAV